MHDSIRILFFGIYDFGLQSLEALTSAGHRPAAVVTKPDAGGPPSPIVEFAARHGIQVFQPDSPKLADFVQEIRWLRPDLSIVAGYDKRIPPEVLEMPVRGTINLHGSLLPRYRGPSTWKQAIRNGEKVTGVTVHVMTPELDRGDILAQQEVAIGKDDTGGSLFGKLCRAGAELLPPTVKAYWEGSLIPVPQREELATYYGYWKDDDAAIDWTAAAEQLVDFVRALNPRPGAWTELRGDRYRIGRIQATSWPSTADPGSVVGIEGDAIRISTGSCDVLATECSAAPGFIRPGDRLGGAR